MPSITSLPPGVESTKDGLLSSVEASSMAAAPTSVECRFREGRVRCSRRPSRNRCGQQLFESGRRVEGAVRQPVREAGQPGSAEPRASSSE